MLNDIDRSTIESALHTKVLQLQSLLIKALKALKDLSTEEIYWQSPSKYWTETDCPGDQMWDTIHEIENTLKEY